jgi:hypothetical protein
MSTIPNSMLICASTPYSRRGVLWTAFKRHYGKPSDVIVWKADTRTMNPLVSQATVDDAYEQDASWAAAEYGGEFRSDLEAFVSAEVVDAAIVPGRFEIPPAAMRYHAFTDPAGGSGGDSFTLAIGHHERGTAVLDLIRERKPPFSPEGVAAEFAADLKRYNIFEVHGDKYAGEWPAEQFLKYGVRYRSSDLPKSGLLRNPAADAKQWKAGTPGQQGAARPAYLVRAPHRAKREGQH